MNYEPQSAEMPKDNEMYHRPNATMEHRAYMEKKLAADARYGGPTIGATSGHNLYGAGVAGQCVDAPAQRSTDLIISRLSNLIDFLDTSAQKLEMFNNRVIGAVPTNPTGGIPKDHPSNGAIFEIANRLNRLDDLAAIISREVGRTQEIG